LNEFKRYKGITHIKQGYVLNKEMLKIGTLMDITEPRSPVAICRMVLFGSAQSSNARH